MENINLVPGPIFEAKPGWGGKIKSWLNKNFNKKILPIVSIAVLLVGIASYFSAPKQEKNNKENKNSQLNSAILIIISPGEGIIATSRRALEKYLNEVPEISLKPEQKLYIDNYFKAKFAGTEWKPGKEVAFLKEEIKKAVDEALALSESKLEKFRTYLK